MTKRLTKNEILSIDFEKDFFRAFMAGGAPSVECHCGRTHVSTGSDSWEINGDENTLQNYINRANSGDNKVVLNERDDFISIIEVGTAVFVPGCECKGWTSYMHFILDEKSEIVEFLVAARNTIKIAAAEFDIISRLKKDYV